MMFFAQSSSLLYILLIGMLGNVPWSHHGNKKVGDLEPLIQEDPVSVNLATSMQAIASAWFSRYVTERVSQVTDTQATVKVQKSGTANETQEITIQYNEAGSRFCLLRTDYAAVWPCVVASALVQAGWDLTKPMSVPDALHAITGHEVKTLYSVNTDSSTTASNFKRTKLDTIQGFITVIVTKKEHSVTGIKMNYAYALVPLPQYPSKIMLDDPDIMGGVNMLGVQWSSAEIFDAVENVYYIDGCNTDCSDWGFP